MSDVSIRTITPGDTEFLPEINYHMIHVPPGTQPPPREILYDPAVAKYWQAWGRAGDFGLIVEDRTTGERVGAAWMRLYSADNPPYGFIAEDIPEISIALLPGYRNRGIGAALIAELIKHAHGRYPALSLSVVDSNPAMRLYKRMGFVQVSVDGHSVTMKLDLRQ